MKDLKLLHLRQSLHQLVVDLQRVSAEASDAIEVLDEEIDGGPDLRTVTGALPRAWLLDRSTFTVHWGRKTCHLGYSIPYRIMEVLVRNASQYVSHDRLLEQVWHGPRSDSTVRSAVNELRSRLIDSGLREVAIAIDGSNAGHYGLRLRRGSGPAKSN